MQTSSLNIIPVSATVASFHILHNSSFTITLPCKYYTVSAAEKASLNKTTNNNKTEKKSSTKRRLL